jgi:hypothetical protein
MRMQDGHLIFPALSIPVENKDEFSCPVYHIAFLKDLLPRVTKVITIGWRGMEADFLELLRRHLPQEDQKLMIVSGKMEGAQETQQNLRHTIKLHYPPLLLEQGFTGLIHNLHQLSAFLS